MDSPVLFFSLDGIGTTGQLSEKKESIIHTVPLSQTYLKAVPEMKLRAEDLECLDILMNQGRKRTQMEQQKKR